MKPKKLLILTAILLFSAVLLSLSSPLYAFPAVRVYPTSLNFGNVNPERNYYRVFYVANTGSSLLTVSLSEGSPIIRLSRHYFSVRPGSRVAVRVVLRARSFDSGYRSGRIIVNTNAGRRYVYWRARVVPSYRPAPSPTRRRGVSRTFIDFGIVSYSRDTRYITLYNPFPFPIRVRVSPRAPWIRIGYSTITIPPFGSRRFPITVYVDYFPGSSVEGYVTFYFPWGAVNVRVIARLGGGYPPPYPARARVSPTYLDFGTVWYGTTRVKYFVVRNYSSTPFRVRIAENAYWLSVYPLTTYVPPHGSRRFAVRVYGSKLPAGWRSAYIRVYTGAGAYSVRVVARGGI